jgi:hypothetical protein
MQIVLPGVLLGVAGAVTTAAGSCHPANGLPPECETLQAITHN